MVRTAANTVRVSGGKAAKVVTKSSTSTSRSFQAPQRSSSDRGSVGGNPFCPRETPAWQRPITNFFIKQDEVNSSSSLSKTPVKNDDCDNPNDEVKNRTDTIAIRVTKQKFAKKNVAGGEMKDDHYEGKYDQAGEGCSRITKTLITRSNDCQNVENNENKENEVVNKNTVNTLEIKISKKTCRTEDDEDRVPYKRQKIEFYKDLEAVESIRN